MLMPAWAALPETSQRVTVISLSYVVSPWPLRRMQSWPQFLTMTLSMFTRDAAGALMPWIFAPLPSSTPPPTETLVAPEEIAMSGTVTAEVLALIVAPVATRHMFEPSVRLLVLTLYVLLARVITSTLLGW